MTMTSTPGSVLNRRATDVRDRLKNTVHQVQDATDRAKDRVERPIRSKPVGSVLVAAAGAVLLGFLAGVLTGCKRH